MNESAPKNNKDESRDADAHVDVFVAKQKEIYKKTLDIARERLAGLNTSKEVLFSPQFPNFFKGLVKYLTYGSDSKLHPSAYWNLEEIKTIAHDGLKIFYDSVRSNLHFRSYQSDGESVEIGQMAGEILGSLPPTRFNINQEDYIPILSPEDEVKLKLISGLSSMLKPHDREDLCDRISAELQDTVK